MADEVNAPSTTEGAPESTPTTEAPTDFREFVKWRETGELPAKDEAPPAAAATEEAPPATSEPQSGADETQQPEEPEDEEQEPEKPGRGSSRQRKIDRLTRENELLKAQLDAVRPKAPPPEPAKPPGPAGKPKLENFRTLEEYQEALTDWKLDQREAAKAAQSAEQAAQTAWSKSETSARAAHADYDDVVKSVKAPDGPGVLAARQAMLEDEAGAEVLYHLATHPEELQRIAALPPVAAITAVAKLSAKLNVPVAENGKSHVTSAPKPPPELKRPAKTATQNLNDENFARTDYKGWEKLRVAQLKG